MIILYIIAGLVCGLICVALGVWQLINYIFGVAAIIIGMILLGALPELVGWIFPWGWSIYLKYFILAMLYFSAIIRIFGLQRYFFKCMMPLVGILGLIGWIFGIEVANFISGILFFITLPMILKKIILPVLFQKILRR